MDNTSARMRGVAREERKDIGAVNRMLHHGSGGFIYADMVRQRKDKKQIGASWLRAPLLAVATVILSACATSPGDVRTLPSPYRAQVEGLLSGRVDPWEVNPAAWGRAQPRTEPNAAWAPEDQKAYAAWQALANEVNRREEAEKPNDLELWQGGLRYCHSYRTMILTVHLAPGSWDSAPTATPQFSPARDRVRAKFVAFHAAEKKIAIKGTLLAQAEARLARSAVYQWPTYAGPDPTGESNYFGYLLRAEECRLHTENLMWIDKQLRDGRMVTGGDQSDRAIRASYALLHQSASRSSILIRWLPVFEPYARRGIVAANDYARSVDNILISTKRPQKYGSYQTCRGEIDRSNVHSEGPPVDRQVLIANRMALRLEPLETVEAATREHCARTFPFSM